MNTIFFCSLSSWSSFYYVVALLQSCYSAYTHIQFLVFYVTVAAHFCISYVVNKNSTQLSNVHSFPIAILIFLSLFRLYDTIRFQKIICHKYSEIIMHKCKKAENENGMEKVRAREAHLIFHYSILAIRLARNSFVGSKKYNSHSL